MAIVFFLYLINGFLSYYGIAGSVKTPINTFSMLVFGSLAGVVGGATSAMSPILMMFLFSKTNNIDEIVKASNLCYFLGKVVQVIMI